MENKIEWKQMRDNSGNTVWQAPLPGGSNKKLRIVARLHDDKIQWIDVSDEITDKDPLGGYYDSADDLKKKLEDLCVEMPSYNGLTNTYALIRDNCAPLIRIWDLQNKEWLSNSYKTQYFYEPFGGSVFVYNDENVTHGGTVRDSLEQIQDFYSNAKDDCYKRFVFQRAVGAVSCGKDIYEGDVVEHEAEKGGSAAVVVYDKEAGMFDLEPKPSWYTHWKANRYFTELNIVGNIFGKAY